MNKIDWTVATCGIILFVAVVIGVLYTGGAITFPKG